MKHDFIKAYSKMYQEILNLNLDLITELDLINELNEMYLAYNELKGE